MQKKKLLLVGSNSIHTYNYLELVASFFDEIILITNKKREGSEFETVELDFSLKISNLLNTVKGIKKTVKEFEPTVIHVHQVNSCAFYTALACSNSRIPIVLTSWGSDILLLPERSWLFKKMVQFSLNRADYYTSDSVFMADKMKILCPKIKDVLIANFGISIDPMEVEKENIIYSNRLHKKLYRVDNIITSFKLFLSNQEKSENWKLIIAATGEETESLKELVVNLDLNQNVEFVGWVNKEDNALWYSKSKIWVSIPESDATSISLLEAMACGCIPIVSDLPANKEWIKDGVNGIIVKDMQSNFIAQAFEINKELAIQINKVRVAKDGTKDANRSKFIELYQTILS